MNSPASQKSGKLKVFLGMCPGVGKTYEMLQNAAKLKAAGTDIVIGVVETHGRKETHALLDGLEIIPPQKIDYRESSFAEMDIDALLARNPAIALVDELAHSNVPGSRHPKRWQDVAELLDAGINVHTTLNIQHLESRSEIVTSITGAPVRETVPDSFLDRADEIEFIDITPRDLQLRMEEGKVYLGERANAAAKNFFKESHLTALRQMGLRYTAERVGANLRDLRSRRRDPGAWRSSEKLVVAVGPSPYSPSLIRRTRAMAGALDAPWSAIAVSTDDTLSEQEKNRLTENLSLARQLGAETATVESTGLVEGLLTAARERGATQIVIGKTHRHGWRDFFLRPPALRLLQASGDIDVIAMEPNLPAGEIPPTNGRDQSSADIPGLFTAFLKGALIAALLAIIAYSTSGFFKPEDLAMLMLCGVIVGSLFLSFGGTIFLAILTGLLWNFLFTEPRLSFHIASSSDLILFAALLVSSLSMGYLSNRLKRRNLAVNRQQRNNTRLLEINTIITGASDSEEAVAGCLRALDSLFGLKCAIQLRSDTDHSLRESNPASTLEINAKERGVALWAFEKKQPAGKGTSTLPEAKALHLPLLGRSYSMGVLSVDPGPGKLPLVERDLLAAIAAQIGLGLERNHLLHAIHHANFIERSDELRRSLLDHVSHELRTPVAVIGSALDAIDSGTPPSAIIQEMRGAQKRLRRVTDQLVESARIEAGSVIPRPEWCDLSDLLETAASAAEEALNGHPFEISIETGTPALVCIDADIFHAALTNLLANAGHHTPPGTPVTLLANITNLSELEVRVRDKGLGLENPARVFDRFHRGTSSRPGGLGLGLSIVRGLARGLGGSIAAANIEPTGAEFLLKIPVRTAHEIPAEHT